MKHLSQCKIEECHEALKSGRTLEDLAGELRIDDVDYLSRLLELNRPKSTQADRPHFTPVPDQF